MWSVICVEMVKILLYKLMNKDFLYSYEKYGQFFLVLSFFYFYNSPLFAAEIF